jgi:FKBP-type peptidyl-prolyl cis-trans isomerase FkpA
MIAAVIFLLYACKKTENNGCVTDYGHPTTTEVTNLRTFINTNGISATEDPRGFFYHIIFAGAGTESPVPSDSVEVKYKGTLTSGTIFDSTRAGTTAKFLLSDLITGWQVGLPLLKQGGVMDLYLPSSFGYGCNGNGPIPGGAITIFRMELVNF